MLTLLCLFKLIIKDRAPPPPPSMPEERRICLCSTLPRKLMMNYFVYQVTPINKPADSPVSIPAIFSLASVDRNLDPEDFFFLFVI